MKKVYKNLISIALGLLSYTCFAQIPTNGLVASYPFNNNANDEAGNTIVFNGIPTPNSTIVYQNDRWGNAQKAMYLNGTTTGIRVPNFTLSGSSFTIGAWLKADNGKVNAYIGHGTNTTSTGSNPGTANKNFFVNYQNSLNVIIAEGFYNNDFSLVANNQSSTGWDFVVVNYDNNTKKRQIYYNGELKLPENIGSSYYLGTGDLYLGQITFDNLSSPYNLLKGLIDDVKIYNRVLSNTEVKNIYTELVPPTWVTVPGTNICTGSTIYQINAVAKASQYIWALDGVTVAGVSGTQYTKNWQVSDVGTHIISVLSANIYGVSSSALVTTVTINALPSTPTTIIGSNTLCVNSIPGNSIYTTSSISGAISYVWWLNGTLIPNATTTSTNIAFSSLGNAQSISVAGFNICGIGTSKSLSVDVKSIPGIPTTIISEPVYCMNSKANILTNPIGGATAYEWKINGNSRAESGLYIAADFSSSVSGFTVGSNTISIAALNGTCKSIAYLTTITLNSTPMGVTINGSDPVCPLSNQNAYTVTSNDPQALYFWRLTSPDPTVNYQAASNTLLVNFPYNQGVAYTIQVTANNSCGNSIVQKTVTLKSGVPPIPQISCLGKNGSVCTLLGFTNAASIPSGTTISWKVDNVSIPGLNNQQTIVLANYPGTTYSAVLANNGCAYGNSFGECVQVRQGQSARKEAEEITANQSSVLIYPNPNSGSFIIETDGAEGYAYIINTSGQLIDSIKLPKGVYINTILLSTSGLYIIKVKTESTNKTFKVMVN